ncbi:hypothetical protein AB691_0545 [Stutzerimonas stutzeri]|nr:hypothetical protein AB691_0545 [Stutzerimonas stutzeri]
MQPMKTLTDHLAQYAAYHRDPRNLLTHFVGIPLIVVAVAVLLSRPGIAWAGLWLSPAALVSLVAALFYLRLDLRYGMLMSAVLALCLWLGALTAGAGTALWLGIGVGLFVVGWIIQFVGHYFEGRKPAFVDDLSGLIIGPLFVAAELGFMLGLREPLRLAIEARVGPVRLRHSAAHG